MKEFRYISQVKVRQICIKYDLFTCGDNDSYNDLFEYIGNLTRKGQNVSVEKLRFIAKIIKDNSDKDYSISEIMLILNEECCATVFE